MNPNLSIPRKNCGRKSRPSEQSATSDSANSCAATSRRTGKGERPVARWRSDQSEADLTPEEVLTVNASVRERRQRILDEDMRRGTAGGGSYTLDCDGKVIRSD